MFVSRWRAFRVSRCSQSFRTACQQSENTQFGRPLDASEYERLHVQIAALAKKKPDLARLLLAEIHAHDGNFVPRRPLSVSMLNKVADAKLMRRKGQGKTVLFAYLSVTDKGRVLQLTGAEGAEEMVTAKNGKTAFFAGLPGEVKYNALRAWQKERAALHAAPDKYSAPTSDQLVKLALANGVPMVGFGFADNFLMIIFGEAIEFKLGLYVSTMAAAGLGNLCSNILGLGLADYIEQVSKHLGLPLPDLSPAQRETGSARAAGLFGTVSGVAFGCSLGMMPLLFMGGCEEANHAEQSSK